MNITILAVAIFMSIILTLLFWRGGRSRARLCLRVGLLFAGYILLVLGSCTKNRSDVNYGPPEYFGEKEEPKVQSDMVYGPPIQMKKDTPPSDVDYGPPEYFDPDAEDPDSLNTTKPGSDIEPE